MSRFAKAFALIATLTATLSCTPAATLPSAVPAVARLSVPTVAVVAKPEAQTETAKPAAAAPERVLRRIKGSEMTVPVVKMARTIINENYKKPFGYEVEFEIDGKHYVGRIEQHYHPPGGPLHPWGPHAGCSLYVVEQG